jgi:hypothetical protein
MNSSTAGGQADPACFFPLIPWQFADEFHVAGAAKRVTYVADVRDFRLFGRYI